MYVGEMRPSEPDALALISIARVDRTFSSSYPMVNVVWSILFEGIPPTKVVQFR